ncbi:hypothetical protein Poli38472_000727 [Pythium oligandrum]|uniref:RNA polymerase II-associated factor 1 n=1 Tax=Pythium oligandrum TaxID=41045 RepID=A0A8K1CCM9_PYTOL|nr:hypothetical protein Poli38472_000727 [Pythium oligandrum]|eukprot:TMW60685.1 hypothetical protein Poli38472_000727 [Pythium oligandrum]
MADVIPAKPTGAADVSKGSSASSSSSSSAARPASSSSGSSSRNGGGSASDRAREEAKRRRAPPGKDATPEERAQYELERKKIQKYKEDKLKARRDHTRMILESHAQAKRRALLGKQSEFLTNLEFRNTLPDLPFDTKFLQYPHEADRLIKYKPNSLEMDYVYEVHEDSNLGLNIDLIDPAKYEVPENPGPLEVGDEQVLMMKEVNAKNGKAKARPSVTWLRRTEYMGTDLSEMTHKFKSEVEIQSALREGTENALAEVVQLSLEDRAEASFRDASNAKTLVHPFKKNLKAAKVWDVFPDQIVAPNKYAILSYDLLPSQDLKGKSVTERESRALLCGVSKKSQGADVVQGSILLPNARDEEEKDNDEPQAEKFGYYREYQLSIDVLENRVRDESQHVIFMLDPESNHFTYADLLHRIQLRKTKLNGDEKRRRGAIVRRRDYSEAELERRQALLFETGGLYDESLDDAELVREHKRRRAGGDDSADEESKSNGDEQATNGAGGDSPAISSGSESD